MGRILPFYRTGGLLSGGGGGGVLGDATVWPAVLDWTALGTIAGPLRVGDRVPVGDLGPGVGIAEYNGTDWELVQAVFATVADLNAFSELIVWGATASVGTGVETDPMYYYDGSTSQWLRMAEGIPWAYSLSSLRDFSAVGLQDGDYGVLTPSGGQPILLRYKAACPTAYGSPMPVWITPIAYAGTPIVQAWTDGTESNVTLAAQGWTLVADSAGCTVTATGGFQRLTTPTSQNAMRLHTMVNGVAAATRMESIFETRASTAGTNVLVIYFLTDGTNCSILGQVGTLGLGWKDAAFGGPLQTPLRNSTATALPTLAQTAAWIVMRDEGRTVLSSADRDGLPLGNYRRNLQALAANRIAVTAQGSAGGVAATLDYRGQIITY